MTDATVFLDEVSAAMAADLGAPLDSGTVIVPTEARSGSRSAVAYPLPGQLALWCDPAVAELLRPLAGSQVLTLDEFIDQATGIGAEVGGRGRNLTLDDGLQAPTTVSHAEVRVLSRGTSERVALMRTLSDVLSDDDLEEAELDIDELDERLVALVTNDTVLAFASGIEAVGAPAFDDIGVAVHPEYRRRGLGAAVVAAFVDEFCVRGDRLPLYRHDVDNVGSAALAESLGFTPVHTIGSVRWP